MNVSYDRLGGRLHMLNSACSVRMQYERLSWNASTLLANTIRSNRVDNVLVARKKDVSVSNQALIDDPRQKIR